MEINENWHSQFPWVSIFIDFRYLIIVIILIDIDYIDYLFPLIGHNRVLAPD